LFAIAGATRPKPPYVGEVAADHVYVRAGDGINYTVLAVAERGARMRVTRERFGWLATPVPESCTVWVHKSLLTPEPGGKEATVARDRVNVRARAKPRADIVGQLPRGARVKVVDEDGDWCGIAPPPQASAWVHGRYMRKVAEIPPQPPPKAKKGMDVAAAVTHLRKAAERYRAELAKPAKERNFGEVLTAYQKVASQCQDPMVARRAEQARQRLLKIVDLHQALQAAREPLEEFEKKYGALEAEFKRRAKQAGERKPD